MKSRTKSQKIGLIVGKFAPLHKGHQFLIEKALEKVDRLIIIVYRCPETKIPLKIRVGWLKRLYPKVTVISGSKAPLEHGNDPKITQQNIEYVKSLLSEKITHVFSSEWYGQRLSEALGAKNVVVDKKRMHFPVSGTMIRNDLEKYKKFLSPLVYKELKKPPK
ncbi:MAG: adenylyltransferase/cytidyltransferase family protein [Patescibacteria group bacterium]|jgi:NadR type nicotinamide-nucleotide adenylyltransferase